MRNHPVQKFFEATNECVMNADEADEAHLLGILGLAPICWKESGRFRYSFFVKVPRPGDSEVTFSVFESSYHLLLPV